MDVREASQSYGHQHLFERAQSDILCRGATEHDDTSAADDPGQPSEVVLCAVTAPWLPVAPNRIFDFFRDKQMRAEWDVLSSGNTVPDIHSVVKVQC